MQPEALTLSMTPALLRQKAAARWRAVLLSAVCSLAAVSAMAAAEAPALLTLLEGEATLIIGARAFAAAAGARVPGGTLVETETRTGLLRLEWADGAILDLGPGTRVMLRPALVGPGSASLRAAPLFYLLQGWAKHSQPTAANGQLAAAFDVAPFKGVLLSQVDDTHAVLFTEAGGAGFTPRRAGGKGLSLRAGEAAVLSATALPQLSPRPAPAWLQQLPRAFRETLPSRAAQWAQGPAPVLRAQPAPAYASLQHWLVAEPALRRAFPARFAELLSDRTFKAAVNARLKQHPEWEPLLRPRPRSGAASRKNNLPADPEPAR